MVRLLSRTVSERFWFGFLKRCKSHQVEAFARDFFQGEIPTNLTSLEMCPFDFAYGKNGKDFAWYNSGHLGQEVTLMGREEANAELVKELSQCDGDYSTYAYEYNGKPEAYDTVPEAIKNSLQELCEFWIPQKALKIEDLEYIYQVLNENGAVRLSADDLYSVTYSGEEIVVWCLGHGDEECYVVEKEVLMQFLWEVIENYR